MADQGLQFSKPIGAQGHDRAGAPTRKSIVMRQFSGMLCFLAEWYSGSLHSGGLPAMWVRARSAAACRHGIPAGPFALRELAGMKLAVGKDMDAPAGSTAVGTFSHGDKVLVHQVLLGTGQEVGKRMNPTGVRDRV